MSTEHALRISRFQDSLRSQGLDSGLVLHAVDIFYLAGTRQNSALHVPVDGAPILIVRKSLARASSESGVSDVRPFPPSKQLAEALGMRGKVGVPFDGVTAAALEWWRKAVPGAVFVDLGTVLREHRATKSPSELAIMREGGKRVAKVLGEIPTFLRAGMRELDLAAEIEARLRRAGNMGVPRMRGFNSELFLGLTLSGVSACAPGFFDGPAVGRGLGPAYPSGASDRIILTNEPVLCDYAPVFDGYVVDMTRCFVVGELPQMLRKAFDVALEIQGAVSADLRPGVTGSELWTVAETIAKRAGLADHFMGPAGDQARFVGHGVGLELDELPLLSAGYRAPLADHQVVALEPKFVFPGIGAIGLENTWVVTPAGGERLTLLGDEIVSMAA